MSLFGKLRGYLGSSHQEEHGGHDAHEQEESGHAEEKSKQNKDYVVTLGLGGAYDKEGKAVNPEDETMKFRDSAKAFSGIREGITEIKNWMKKKLEEKEKEGIKMDRHESIAKEMRKLDEDLGEVAKLKAEAENLATQQTEVDALSSAVQEDSWENPYAENSDPGEEADQDDEEIKPKVEPTPTPEVPKAEKTKEVFSEIPALNTLAEYIIKVKPLKTGNEALARKMARDEELTVEERQSIVQAVESIKLERLPKKDKDQLDDAVEIINRKYSGIRTMEALIKILPSEVQRDYRTVTEKLKNHQRLTKKDWTEVSGLMKVLNTSQLSVEERSELLKAKTYVNSKVI